MKEINYNNLFFLFFIIFITLLSSPLIRPCLHLLTLPCPNQPWFTPPSFSPLLAPTAGPNPFRPAASPSAAYRLHIFNSLIGITLKAVTCYLIFSLHTDHHPNSTLTTVISNDVILMLSFYPCCCLWHSFILLHA